MTRRVPSVPLRFTVLALLLPALSACGLFDFEEREPWRAQAEAACFARKEVVPSSAVRPMSKISGPGICGVDRPLKVAALRTGEVDIVPAATLDCPMTAALDRWMASVVQPAAYARYGVPVIAVKNMASYGCRTRNHAPGAKLSEHAFANALDVGGFRFADGREVTVKSGWRAGEADRAFLREVLIGACGPFRTVLGPGSDGMHEDHFHLDLARHNARGEAYCRPKLTPPPPAAPPVFMASPARGTVPVAAAAPPPGPVPPQQAAPGYPAPGYPAADPATPRTDPAMVPAATPMPPASVGAPPLVWQRGPGPLGYGGVTGSVP